MGRLSRLNLNVQDVACCKRGLRRPFTALSKCFACCQPEPKASCRFADCRALDDKSGVSFNYKPEPNPLFPQHFNRPMTAEDVSVKLKACAEILYPILLQEKDHQALPNLIYRPRELEYRITYTCSTALFAQTWLCTGCGWEQCNDCLRGGNTVEFPVNECKHDGLLRPISRFQETELHDAIAIMEPFLDLPSLKESTQPTQPCDKPPSLPSDASHQHRDAPRFHQNLNSVELADYLRRGVPVVVTGIQIQGTYDPQYFRDRYRTRPVLLQNCETGQQKRSTVEKFFETFGKPWLRTKRGIWKLKDWPPQKDFRSEFPQLFDAFMSLVPCPDIASLIGVLNLAAHLPENGIMPDLGPKMYNAEATLQDDQHHGSTCLHMDLTDAVNIMLWAADPPDGGPNYAVWDLFSPEDSSIVRKFLKEVAGFKGEGDPIHSQTICMTPTLLKLLWETYGVRSYRIYQRVGEAVYIPAGCAHQVSNATDAIKIACDYVSIANLQRTHQLLAEFREHRLLTNSGDDVLQFYTVLWYAFLWLSKQQWTLNSQAGPPAGDVETPDIEMSNVGNLDLSISDNSSSFAASPGAPLTKAQKKSNKFKMRRKAALIKPRAEKPDQQLLCPMCPRKFHRNGLVNHIGSTHKTRVADMAELDRAAPGLRNESLFTDDEVSSQICSILKL